jgi:hypothetical protein
VALEIGDESSDTRALYAKYRKESLWLLLPFAVAIADVSQRLKNRKRRPG